MDWLNEEADSQSVVSKSPWKVVIVDDDYEVFQVTKLALSHFVFEERALDLVYASSAEAGKKVFQDNDDIALAIVDVVMESDDAGLQLVEYIRTTLENRFTRIVLRTGQPGFAPESDVIQNYDIDGYKSKTELTQQSLTHCFYTSLRCYRDLVRIQRFQIGLEALVDSLRSMQSLETFDVVADSLLLQIRSVLSAYDSELVIQLKAVDGLFSSQNTVRRFNGDDQSNSQMYSATIQQSLTSKRDIVTDDIYAHYHGSGNYESVLLLVGAQNINKYSRRLIKLFSENVCVFLDKLVE